MPRPYPPALLSRPTVSPFQIEPGDQGRLARTLGMSRLSPEARERIAHVVAIFKATERGSPDTTVGNTLAQLNELNKTGRSYDQAIAHLADDRCGIDYTTHAVLQPLAKAVSVNKPGAREELACAAGRRTEELREHKRVNPASESLRHFCGMLRVIFAADATPEMRRSDEGWRNLRRFAMEVFTIAGIDHGDFDAHPERLTDYFGTDVTSE